MQVYFRTVVRRAISQCIDCLIVCVWDGEQKYDQKRWAVRKLRRVEREALVKTF